MAEKGQEGDQPKIKPSLRETLASAEGANELNQSDKRGQSLKDDAKWKIKDGRGTSSGQKEAGPLSRNRSSWRRRSSTSYGGDLRQLLNRGANWKEESLSPPDWAETNPDDERSSHSLAKDDLSKCLETSRTVCKNRTRVENENQPGLGFSSSAHIKLSDLKAENRGHNGRRPHAPAMTRSRSRSLSPGSQAAHNAKQDSDSKDTDCWHKALDQTGFDELHRGSNRRSAGPRPRPRPSAFRSRDRRSLSTEEKRERTGRYGSRSPEHKWRKTGLYPDRSRFSERSVSPENRPRKTGRDRCRSRGRSRGRGSKDSSRISRRGVQEPRDQSQRSPAPKQRRTGWDLERRSRGSDSSHSPDYKQKRTGKRGRTNSPSGWQKRREKRDPSNSPIKISSSRRSPGLHRRSPHGCPFQMPVSDGTISSTTPSAVPKERFSNAADDAAMKLKMSTSCSRGPDTINPVSPTTDVLKLGQPQSNQNGTTVVVLQSHSFKRAVAGFAKAKLRSFWLTRQLKDYVYWHVRHQFVSNVVRNLERRFPHIHTLENIFKFDKENNHNLSSLLKWYLRRFLSEDIIKRYFLREGTTED